MHFMWQNALMKNKQNLIISLDDLIFNLPTLKNSIWRDLTKIDNLDPSELFLNLSFDASFEKKERLGREYPAFAPYFDKVEEMYNQKVNDYILNYNLNSQDMLIIKKFSEDFAISILTNLSHHQLQKSNALSRLDFEINEVFSTKDVFSGKPEADIYLRIARKLNVKPSKLITVDGSVNGVQAGFLAKTKAIYIAKSYSICQWVLDYSTAYLKDFKELETTLYTWLKNQSE